MERAPKHQRGRQRAEQARISEMITVFSDAGTAPVIATVLAITDSQPGNPAVIIREVSGERKSIGGGTAVTLFRSPEAGS